MFTITGDTLAGIVVGFALGVLAHHIYIKYAYEITEDEKPTEKPVGTTESKEKPRTTTLSEEQITECKDFSKNLACRDYGIVIARHLNRREGR